MEIPKEDFQKAIRTIMEKAAKDEKFRPLCLSNPDLALKGVEGLNIPQGLKLTFVENIEASEQRDQSINPEANNVIIELSDKGFFRVMQMEGGIRKVYTYTFDESEEIVDYDPEDVG